MKKTKEQGRRGAPEALPYPKVQERGSRGSATPRGSGEGLPRLRHTPRFRKASVRWRCLVSTESLWEEPSGSKGHRGCEGRPELAGRDNRRWQGGSPGWVESCERLKGPDLARLCTDSSQATRG